MHLVVLYYLYHGLVRATRHAPHATRPFRTHAARGTHARAARAPPESAFGSRGRSNALVPVCPEITRGGGKNKCKGIAKPCYHKHCREPAFRFGARKRQVKRARVVTDAWATEDGEETVEAEMAEECEVEE